MPSEIRLLPCFYPGSLRNIPVSSRRLLPPVLPMEFRQESDRKGEGKRQKASGREPVPFDQENDSSPGGPAQETFSYIHWPELGHMATPNTRASGK